MAFAQSFYNQSSVLSINVLVVDDDPVFLQIMSRMLEKSKHRDPSVMEITVIAAKDPIEALSTLKIQRNNIDLIITDYYMPGMNGLQLKSQINQEYGNLPVIVMSSDTNKEEESLTCGAISFLPKPIKPIDLPKIYQYALTYKRNGKSILWTDQQNHKDTNVSVPQQIQLLPEQTDVSVPQQNQLLPEQDNFVKAKKKKRSSSRSDSRSVSSTNTSCVSTDGSRKNLKRKSSDSSGDDVPQPAKKRKVKWTEELHHLFLRAIRHIGLDKAVPKKILEFMNVPYLTRENVASHLQKFRIFLKKVAEQALITSSVFTGRGIDSNFSYAHITEPYYNYYTPSTTWFDTSLTNKSFYSKPGHGLGQSRLLSNTRDSVRFNQTTPYNYMNRSSIYEPNRVGSNLNLPNKSNLNVSNQPSQNEERRSFFEPPVNEERRSFFEPPVNEERRSFFEPPVMANKIGQTSQVLGVGQHEPAATKGTNFNNNMLSSYGNLTPNQPRLRNYGPNQPGHNSYAPTQPGLMSYGSFTPNQSGLSSYGSLISNQPGLLSSYGSLTPSHAGPSSYGSSTPSQPGLMNSYGSSNPNQSGPSSYGSLTPNQSGLISSYGSLSPNQPGPSSYGSVTPNQTGPSSYGSVTPNQPGPNSYGSSSPNQPGPSGYGSLSPNQPGLSSYGSVSPNQPGPSHFSYGMQSFVNNEKESYKPPQQHANATTQPNLEIPQLESLNLYDDLGNISELPCETSNFQLDHNKQQGEAASTNFELLTFPSEMNQIFSLEDDYDWTFVNIDQGPSNGETSTTLAAPETNSSIFNMNTTHYQEEDVPNFTDWLILDSQDLVDDDFMASVFNNDMN